MGTCLIYYNMDNLDLFRTDSEEFDAEVSLLAEAIRITDQEHETLLKSLEDDQYIPSFELLGTILMWRDELCVIAKGKNNNYFLIYI